MRKWFATFLAVVAITGTSIACTAEYDDDDFEDDDQEEVYDD